MKLKLGQGFTLTTEHGASSYGIPVLLDKAGQAYGPADLAPGTRRDLKIEAKLLVAFLYRNRSWSWRSKLTLDEKTLLSKFGAEPAKPAQFRWPVR